MSDEPRAHPEIPPALLALLDQQIAHVSAALDLVVAAARVGLTEESRTVIILALTHGFLESGSTMSSAVLTALAAVQLAERTPDESARHL
jgi:hypothetical protein